MKARPRTKASKKRIARRKLERRAKKKHPNAPIGARNL